MKTNNIPISELISSYNYSKSFISDKLDEVISLERILKKYGSIFKICNS